MRLAALAGLAAAWPTGAAAACRLGLVLALDVSASVDPGEYALQTGGIATALVAPEVAAAILGAGAAPVHLTVFEWSNAAGQTQILPWTALTDGDALARAAAIVAGHARRTQPGRTAVGAALAHAGRTITRGPVCNRYTVDISADGANNIGPEPGFARYAQGLEGVTINALVIGGRMPLDAEPFAPFKGSLNDWYAKNVTKGAGAFVMSADTYGDYAQAMRAKLLREVGGLLIGEAAR